MAEIRRAGSRYRHPNGMEIKLSRRVPECENELWFAEITKAGSQGLVDGSGVVAGASLDGIWEKL